MRFDKLFVKKAFMLATFISVLVIAGCTVKEVYKGYNDEKTNTYFLYLEGNTFLLVSRLRNGPEVTNVRLSGTYKAGDDSLILTPEKVEISMANSALHGAGYNTKYDYSGESINLTKTDDILLPPMQRYVGELNVRERIQLKKS